MRHTEASRTSEEDKRQKAIGLENEYRMPIFNRVFSSPLALRRARVRASR
jgi:hypothetical protein